MRVSSRIILLAAVLAMVGGAGPSNKPPAVVPDGGPPGAGQAMPDQDPGPAVQLAPTRLVIPTDAEIDRLVKALQEALFKFQVDQWALATNIVTVPPPAGGGMAVQVRANVPPQMGTLVLVNPNGIRFRFADGREMDIPHDEVRALLAPGHFQPEYSGQVGGHTAMAIWALVASGMDLQDPRMKKALDGAVKSRTPWGTYSLALRMAAFSHLVRWGKPGTTNEYRQILVRENQVMLHAMNQRGGYSYRAFPPPGFRPGPKPNEWIGAPENGWSDNSNAQFGVYGVWAGEDGSAEVPFDYWRKVDQYWREEQNPDGGWPYVSNKSRMADVGNVPLGNAQMPSTPQMTEAALNSLYLVVDRLWSRQVDQRGYRRLEGFRYDPRAIEPMHRTLAAIDKGWQWAETYASRTREKARRTITIGGWGLYRQYGMQRLGLFSGRKYVADQPWLEEVLAAAYRNGMLPQQPADARADPANPAPQAFRYDNIIQDISWRLLCLSFGRDPVLINKLDTGDERDWNYYFRDIANLTDWISHQTERRHNWQIVNLKRGIDDLLDAPILFIGGSRRLNFDAAELSLLRRYCDLGGTIILHPNLNNSEFKRSAEETFVRLFAAQGREFERIPKDHGFYTALGTPEMVRKVQTIPLRGLYDGARYCVILIDGDLAGAWQLRMHKPQEDLFQVMLNIRQVCAPDYPQLRPRIRPAVPRINESALTKVVVARLRHAGRSDVNPLLYESLRLDAARAGLAIDLRDQAATDNLDGVRLIHITGHAEMKLADEQVADLRRRVAAGGFLLIDPAAGSPEFANSARDLVARLGLSEKPLDAQTDPIFSGIESIGPNRWARDLLRGRSGLAELLLDGRRVGILAEVDLTASASGHHVWGRPAFTQAAARRIWVNVLLAVAKP